MSTSGSTKATGSEARSVVLNLNGRELIFLHSVKPGPASQSYGLHVAELAGVPRDVIERARDYLERLEHHQQSLLPASPQRALHLEPPPTPRPRAEREVIDKLAALDADSLSPRAALDFVYELVRLAKKL